jgi:hypothetical protein
LSSSRTSRRLSTSMRDSCILIYTSTTSTID